MAINFESKIPLKPDVASENVAKPSSEPFASKPQYGGIVDLNAPRVTYSVIGGKSPVKPRGVTSTDYAKQRGVPVTSQIPDVDAVAKVEVDQISVQPEVGLKDLMMPDRSIIGLGVDSFVNLTDAKERLGRVLSQFLSGQLGRLNQH